MQSEINNPKSKIGYVISRDRYLKRDELGIIYQLCVVPGEQRKLIGAALVKAVFERSAYGCRLYCCWCAQDLAANYFWESLGFVPIAFRAGSGKKKRVHIFWQRKIREGDAMTPWWYPAKTDQGAIREDRLVFPIPPGVHWQDVRPPELQVVDRGLGILPEPEGSSASARRAKTSSGGTPKPREERDAARAKIAAGGLFFAPAKGETPKAKTKTRVKRVKGKADPQLVSKARELRDRYLERVNASEAIGALAATGGKYDVSRSLTSAAGTVAVAAAAAALPAPAAA